MNTFFYYEQTTQDAIGHQLNIYILRLEKTTLCHRAGSFFCF